MDDPKLTPTDEREQLFSHLLEKVHTEEELQKQKFVTISTRFYGTHCPAGGVIKYHEFIQSPRNNENKARREALVLDCEMVGVSERRKELAFLAVADLLTGDILINKFVNPTNIVQNWYTRSSGVTCAGMKAAVKNNVVLSGWRAARATLFEFMDRSTILVGHALQNDLNVLGVIHPTIIDTAILTADAVYRPLARPFRRTWSLKALAIDLTGHKIQAGNRGHSALEDTLATRQVLIHCIRNPLDLEAWADRARSQEPVKPEQAAESEEPQVDSWLEPVNDSRLETVDDGWR
ncbi:RNA exonuclease, putative [Penicillium digitatum]|uniref:RNA exonuclease, putative n=3 Tax=Penicillium digitatum TaxID=36651 RepID=K9FX47_PEND2|nr:RNA exonuclease, putative [Penicillium digitatum Pd1]EKV05362.1 RNA exonuclease, putative [Penicillium digitatum Pd1]EKV13689.1 RNA exonuclease, putative [Penicillium digitatum PHI26]QQK40272.1 RNA exonuclease, putative [Penicillium digitatum]